MGIDAKLLVVVLMVVCCVTQNLWKAAEAITEFKAPWWVDNVKNEHSTPKNAEEKRVGRYSQLPRNVEKQRVKHLTRVRWESVADLRKKATRVQHNGMMWELRNALPDKEVAFQSMEFRKFIKTALLEASNRITMSDRKQPPTRPVVLSKTTTFNNQEYEIMTRVEALVSGLHDFHDLVARLYLALDHRFEACGGYTKPSVSLTSIRKVTFEYTILHRVDTTA